VFICFSFSIFAPLPPFRKRWNQKNTFRKSIAKISEIWEKCGKKILLEKVLQKNTFRKSMSKISEI